MTIGVGTPVQVTVRDLARSLGIIAGIVGSGMFVNHYDIAAVVADLNTRGADRDAVEMLNASVSRLSDRVQALTVKLDATNAKLEILNARTELPQK